MLFCLALIRRRDSYTVPDTYTFHGNISQYACGVHSSRVSYFVDILFRFYCMRDERHPWRICFDVPVRVSFRRLLNATRLMFMLLSFPLRFFSRKWINYGTSRICSWWCSGCVCNVGELWVCVSTGCYIWVIDMVGCLYDIMSVLYRVAIHLYWIGWRVSQGVYWNFS